MNLENYKIIYIRATIRDEALSLLYTLLGLIKRFLKENLNRIDQISEKLERKLVKSQHCPRYEILEDFFVCTAERTFYLFLIRLIVSTNSVVDTLIS